MNASQDNRETCESSNQDDCDSVARLSQARRENRRLAQSHYENFLVASVLLPRPIRQAFYDVYAFCRRADDLADESPSPALALQHLGEFQTQLDLAFADRPDQDLFLALHDTIRQFGLRQQPFDDLLEAFRQDQRKTTYASIDEQLDYCRRSANPVGRIVLQLGACSNQQTQRLSDEICTGLQLANFLQDVARDHAIGRIYLPDDQMSRFDVNPSMLGQATASKPLRRLLAAECDRAEQFFHRGLPLVKEVPNWLAKDVSLFAHGGLSTLDAIRAIDFDVLKQRPKVSKARQLWLLTRAICGRL